MKPILIIICILIVIIISLVFFIILNKKRKECYKVYNENSNEFNPQIIPKIIWCYWDSFPLPDKIKKYYDHIIEMHPKFNVKLLYLEKVKQEYPELIPYLQKIKMTVHQSDLVRLFLLNKYGGIYCDLTTIFNVPLYNIFDLTYNGVQGLKCPLNFKKDIIENGFICAPKNNKLIEKWYNEFLYAIIIGFDKYKIEFKKENKEERDIFHWLPYLTQHATLYNILKKIPRNLLDKHIKIYPSLHYDVHVKFNFNNKKIIKRLNKDITVFKKLKHIKLLKMNGVIRESVNINDLNKNISK